MTQGQELDPWLPQQPQPSKTIKRDVPFAWEGRDKRGQRVKGRSLAPDEARCAPSCGARASQRRGSASSASGRRGGRVNAGDIAVFSRQLATMLAAGIPLVQAFEIVGNGNEKPSMQKLILDIKADVEGGTSLHEALGKHPLYFDDLFVNLVEAGEQAGALEGLLDKIATYKEKTEALKKKVKKALFYPAAVLVVAVIVTVVLLIFVIPQFESLYKGFGADLPAFTQMVINLSRFVQHDGIFIAMVAAGLIWTFFYFKKRSRAMREFLDRVVAEDSGHRSDPQQVGHRPLCAHALDHVRRRRAAGRSARSRWPERPATSSTRRRVLKMRDEVATGQRLQRAMEPTGLFPNMVNQMIAVGEESGSLDEMSAKVATFYEAEVDNAVDAMSSLLEPLIMVDARRARRRPRDRHVPADLQARLGRLERRARVR